MSEVIDDDYFQYVGQASINAHPGPELSHALERFIDPVQLRKLGGRALTLRSERTITVLRTVPEDRTTEPYDSLSIGELFSISQQLSRRQHSIHPRISPRVTIHPFSLPQHEDRALEGIDLRFRLAIDYLTQQVLAQTVLIDQEDGDLYVRFRLPRTYMAPGSDLLTARDGLVSLLRTEKPHMIESVYLSSPEVSH